MKNYISIGKFKYKYGILIIIYIFLKILEYIFIDYLFESEKYNNCKLLDPLLFNIGNILCFFPVLIQKAISKNKKNILQKTNKLEETHKGIITYIYNNPYETYITTKDLIRIVFVTILILVGEFCDLLIEVINSNFYKGEDLIKKNYFFIEVLIWFLFSKYFLNITYYKQQIFSIFGIMIIGIIRLIYLFFIDSKINWLVELFKLFIELILIICDSVFYGYIKGLMEYKFYSPYKCCYMFGMINFPIILIIYFIVSFIPCNSEFFCKEVNRNNDSFDDIIYVFKNVNFKEIANLLFKIFFSGVEALLINMTMNDFTFYHIIIPIQIEEFINNIKDQINQEKPIEVIIPLFCYEFLFYLIFLEIIELNFCGLNKNIRKNIEKRAISDLKNDVRGDSYFDLSEDNDDNESINELLPDELSDIN